MKKQVSIFMGVILLVMLMNSVIIAGDPGLSYYVTTVGHDGNDCLSSGTACLTIQAAIIKASAESTINVAAGTYTESQILIDKPLILQGAGKSNTIIDGEGTVTGGLVRITTSGAVTLSGFTIQNTEEHDDLGHGINVDNSGVNVKILDNAIKDVGPVGIRVNTATSVQIERNIISSLYSSTAVIPNGIQIGYLVGVNSPSLGITGTIKDNEISDCSWVDYAVDYENSAATSAGILIMDTTADLEISNNVIHDNNVGIDIEAGASTEIKNNDIHGNDYGVVLWNQYPSINNNKIENNSQSGVYRTNLITQSGTVEATNNWWGTANKATILSIISGSVNYEPYYIDEGMIILNTEKPSITNIYTDPLHPNLGSQFIKVYATITDSGNDLDYANLKYKIEGDPTVYTEEFTGPFSGGYAGIVNGNPINDAKVIYKVYALDTLGNEQTSSESYFIYDGNAPTATVSYSPAVSTNQNVVATITPSETLKDSPETSYTFTSNGAHTFTFQDLAGNTGTATATVNWIDRTVPTATISYSIESLTNQNVVATITPSETLKEGTVTTHTFISNGEHIFTFQDLAGNTGTATATVSNIDTTAPTMQSITPTNGISVSGTQNFVFDFAEANDLQQLELDIVGPTPYNTAPSRIQATFPAGVLTDPIDIARAASMGISFVYDAANQKWTISANTTKTWDASTYGPNPYGIPDGGKVYPDGMYDWYIQVNDVAGNHWGDMYNTLPETTRHWTFDNTAPTITINNPDTNFAQSKTITASVIEGTLKQSITTGSVCDGTLEFIDYSDTTFSLESDNSKRVCYKVVDVANNIAYSISNAIAGIDTTKPFGGLLTVMTVNHPTPGIAISTPTNGVYPVTPALTGTDVFTSLSIVVTDSDLNVVNVPVYIDGTANGNMVYDETNHVWNYVPGTPVHFTEGEHNLVSTFSDNSGNTITLTARFTTDKTAPVGESLTWSTINHPAPNVVSPTGNLYAITPALTGTDVFTSLSIVVTDSDLNVVNVPVYIDGTANGNMVYDETNHVWNYVPGTPVHFTEGEHNLVSTFSDNSGNTITLTARFTTDKTAPVGESLTWSTINHPAPNVVSPTGNLYAITPALTGTDVFTSLSIVVTDSDLNVVNVPVYIDGTANGDMVYSSGVWNYVPGTPVHFTEGEHNLVSTFSDNSGNTVTLTAKFTTDKTAPTIENVVDIVAEATSASGATVIITPPMSHDAVDGDLASTCDESTRTFPIGITTVTCSKTDAAGNVATSEIFTVTVEDTTNPIISLMGVNPVTVEVGSSYIDAGATASDNIDGVITGSIVTVNSVNSAIVGTYTVTYDLVDANGNHAAQVTRTVNIVDTTNPVISLIGTTPVTIEVGSTYTDAGATASDNVDGVITGSIVTVNFVNSAVVRTYTVNYDVVDANGNHAAQVTRTVHVVDTTNPTITLIGANPQIIEVKTAYTELGATAYDTNDGDVSASLVINSNNVNISAVGTYTTTYDAIDSNKNYATQKTRTVNVVDTIPPTIGDDYTNEGVWVNTDQIITLTPEDINGINTVRTCEGIGCEPSTILSSPYKLSYSTDQDTIVRYQAWDLVGNPSSIGEFNIKLDKTKPDVTDSGPGGLLSTSNVNLFVTTDEETRCRYDTTLKSYSNMLFALEQDTALGEETLLTNHTKTVSLTDGAYNYYVRCQDKVGNGLQGGYVFITFNVDTRVNGININLISGWNSFQLPQQILEFNGYTPELRSPSNILSSLEGNYEIIWYYDGTSWLVYDPLSPGLSTLRSFNDGGNGNYWIKMKVADRLELVDLTRPN